MNAISFTISMDLHNLRALFKHIVNKFGGPSSNTLRYLGDMTASTRLLMLFKNIYIIIF